MLAAAAFDGSIPHICCPFPLLKLQLFDLLAAVVSQIAKLVVLQCSQHAPLSQQLELQSLCVYASHVVTQCVTLQNHHAYHSLARRDVYHSAGVPLHRPAGVVKGLCMWLQPPCYNHAGPSHRLPLQHAAAMKSLVLWLVSIPCIRCAACLPARPALSRDRDLRRMVPTLCFVRCATLPHAT